jgi:hypothetical protein
MRAMKRYMKGSWTSVNYISILAHCRLYNGIWNVDCYVSSTNTGCSFKFVLRYLSFKNERLLAQNIIIAYFAPARAHNTREYSSPHPTSSTTCKMSEPFAIFFWWGGETISTSSIWLRVFTFPSINSWWRMIAVW